MNSSNFEMEIKRCEKYIGCKSFKKADAAISNAIHINGDSPYAWYLKAKVSLGLLDYENALDSCTKAIELNPKGEYVQLKRNIENFMNLDSDDLAIGNYPNKLDNMVVLTGNRNISLLSKRRLNGMTYRMILDNLAENVCQNSSQEGDVFSKVMGLAENYIDLEFIANSSCNDSRRVIGAYAFKRAIIDSSLSKTLQIGAIIHELAHHLLFEIFKNTIMYVYQSQCTDTIEALGWYAVSKNVYWRLMNEYCAHSVETHYMPLNNYESFNTLLRNHELDYDKVKKAVELGNSLANDIIYMLDGFFTQELTEEIKMQFLSDRVILLKKGCEFESEGKLSEEEKFSMINSVLGETLVYIKINFSYSELNQFKKIFANLRG